MPDMGLYSISAWEPMTKNTELYQSFTENEMSDPRVEYQALY